MSEPKCIKLSPTVAAFILLFFYISFGVVARETHVEIGNWLQIFLRYLVAFLFCPLLIPQSRGLVGGLVSAPRRDLFILIVRSFFVTIAGVFAWVTAVNEGELGRVAVLQALPIESLWGILLLRETLTRTVRISLLLSIAGVLVMLAMYQGTSVLSSSDIWALCSSFCFPLGFVMGKLHSPSFSQALATRGLFLIGILWLLAILPFVDESIELAQITTPSLFLVLITGVMVLASVRTAEFVFGGLRATLVGIILALESPVAAVVGWLLYSEIPTAGTVVGGIVILSSVLLLAVSREGRESRPVTLGD